MAHSSPPAHWDSSPWANRSTAWKDAHGSWRCRSASPAHTMATRKPQGPHPVLPQPEPRPAAELPVRQSRLPAPEDPDSAPFYRAPSDCLAEGSCCLRLEFAESDPVLALFRAITAASPLWCDQELP